jgi:hypothetical protein
MLAKLVGWPNKQEDEIGEKFDAQGEMINAKIQFRIAHPVSVRYI